MPVVEMAFEPRPQILRQTDVVELSLTVKGVHAVPTSNLLLDDLLVLFEGLPGNIL